MNFLQPIFPLLSVPIHFMMFAAQCHKVFNAVSGFTPTHATRLNVVNIICHRTAYLTRDKITGRIAEMLEIYLCVLLHYAKFVQFSTEIC